MRRKSGARPYPHRKNMNDPIKHHYSPQFYLRQWAGADGRLFRYHRPHSVTTRFMYSLYLRSPHSLAEIDIVLRGTLRDQLEQKYGEAYRAAKQPGDPESVYEHAQQYVPSWWADAHKFLLMQMIDQEEIGHLMVNMIWAVLDLSDAPHFLLTSDRPYHATHGLISSECLVGMPLSPTRLFVAANDLQKLEILAQQSKKDTVRNGNNHVVRMAVENVYGNTGDRRAFVEKRLRRAGQAPVPGLITLEPRTSPKRPSADT